MTVMKKHRTESTGILLTVNHRKSSVIVCNMTSGFRTCSKYKMAMNRKRGEEYEMY